jgi:N-formylglutamate deformylase
MPEPLQMTEAYELIRPAGQPGPVVLASPHSGRAYPAAFLAASRLDGTAIRRSEDSFVDEIFGAGPALGAPMLAANFPRAWCDANREAWELDPAMFADILPAYVNTASQRVAAGLGTVPRIVGTGEPIYADKLRFADAHARITGCWQPFHAALYGLIEETRARFGACLLIDCHSMPSAGGRNQAKPDVVLGDAHGTSCAPGLTEFALSTLGRLGLNVRRNDPYAGGYITRHYGRPQNGVQVIQIELARGLYMNERNFTRGPGFADLQMTIAEFLAAMIQAAPALLASDPFGARLAAE